MCQEVEVRFLSGRRRTFYVPFPNYWNYLIDAVAVDLGYERDEIILFYGGRQYRYTEDDFYVQFQQPWPSVDCLVSFNSRKRKSLTTRERVKKGDHDGPPTDGEGARKSPRFST